MIKIRRTAAAVLAAAVLAVGAGCTSSADRVNENLSTEAEAFRVQRTIVFYNGITGENIAVIEGRCSTENDGAKLRAVCKVGPDEFTRDEIGLSQNVTYFVLQTKTVDVDEYRKKFVLKPGNALPGFDVQVGEQG